MRNYGGKVREKEMKDIKWKKAFVNKEGKVG